MMLIVCIVLYYFIINSNIKYLKFTWIFSDSIKAYSNKNIRIQWNANIKKWFSKNNKLIQKDLLIKF